MLISIFLDVVCHFLCVTTDLVSLRSDIPVVCHKYHKMK